jgi:hypothetical protein
MDHHIIELGFSTILTGVLATLGMTTFLYLSQATGFANGDMVRAIGSAITRREENSLIPGLITHFFFGVVFTSLYVYMLSMVPEAEIVGLNRTSLLVFLGAMMGFLQGLVVSIGLVIVVAEHHPVERFRKAGVNVALIHLMAHVIFGAIIGLVSALI